jgi:bacterioferritin-associated ferredoxin
MVTEQDIQALLKKGASTTKEIQQLSGAGTSCGRCLMTIDSIVEEFQKNRPPILQQKLHFD